MYIPVCPVTELNAQYLAQQRATFETGVPAPDFPGGKGESEHTGRATPKSVSENVNELGLSSVGVAKLRKSEGDELPGAERTIQRANEILGFA